MSREGMSRRVKLQWAALMVLKDLAPEQPFKQVQIRKPKNFFIFIYFFCPLPSVGCEFDGTFKKAQHLISDMSIVYGSTQFPCSCMARLNCTGAKGTSICHGITSWYFLSPELFICSYNVLFR